MSLPSSVRLRMANGGERSISDVRLLERTVTADGGTAQVVRMSAREAHESLLRLVIWGHSHLRVSRSQLVMTSGGPVRADHLSPGDEIGFVKYLDGAAYGVQVSDYVTKPSHRLTRRNR